MPRRRPRIVAIGDAIVDIVTPPLAPIASGDAQVRVPGLTVLPGGNATNFILQIAALGDRAVFRGCVGDDPFAAVLRRAYRAHAVDARLRTDSRAATGATVALTWTDGSRTLITAPGANASLRERDVADSLLKRVDHVHRAGFWWTAGLIAGPTQRILARAKRMGVPTSMDIATDPEGWPPARVSAVRACLPHVDTFFGNEAEVCAVAGIQEPTRAAKELCRRGVEAVVVHRGAKGARYIAGSIFEEADAYRAPTDNPTGCGDVFNAGFVHSRLDGRDIRESLRFANACAALHLRDRSRPYPAAGDVRGFLRRVASP